ncbi:MAG: hypothetical protein ABIH21_05560 [Patescibacteria group bacterium]
MFYQIFGVVMVSGLLAGLVYLILSPFFEGVGRVTLEERQKKNARRLAYIKR